jgi:two-component system KDP operon response regulator KdpE
VTGLQKALLVEDDPNIARLLREILTLHGYLVAEVRDGAAAWEAVHRGKPDLVILDIGLPNVHGLDVLDQIKTHPDTMHVPVIVATAYCTTDMGTQALLGGAAAFVGKPFSVSRIGEAIAAIRADEDVPAATG